MLRAGDAAGFYFDRYTVYNTDTGVCGQDLLHLIVDILLPYQVGDNTHSRVFVPTSENT